MVFKNLSPNLAAKFNIGWKVIPASSVDFKTEVQAHFNREFFPLYPNQCLRLFTNLAL